MLFSCGSPYSCEISFVPGMAEVSLLIRYFFYFCKSAIRRLLLYFVCTCASIFYQISLSQNQLWACVEWFQNLCRSIKPQICQADPMPYCQKILPPLGFLTKWFREKRFAISRNKMGRFACFAVSQNAPFQQNVFRETAIQRLHFAKQLENNMSQIGARGPQRRQRTVEVIQSHRGAEAVEGQRAIESQRALEEAEGRRGGREPQRGHRAVKGTEGCTGGRGP